MIARGLSADVPASGVAVELEKMLEEMVDREASDLLLICGEMPKLRIHGSLEGCKSYQLRLTTTEANRLVDSLLTGPQRNQFEHDQELDFSFGIAGLSRFRANVYCQRGTIALVIRQVPLRVRTLDELGLPDVIGSLTGKTRGLILVTGSAGSGKSTTLAAMIEKINQERSVHVVTIEDPIEFVHVNAKSTISQREVGSDTHSFSASLRHVLRQSPDVVLIGEMRDLETISAALTIAETGHLTLATLHTNSAAEAINRIVDVFPAHQQGQVRAQLAIVLEAVITQTLVPRADGEGRVCAAEIMLCTPAIRTAIRENRTHQILNVIDTSRGIGMQSLDRALQEHYAAGRIKRDDALKFAADPEALARWIMGPVAVEGGAPMSRPTSWPDRRPGGGASIR